MKQRYPMILSMILFMVVQTVSFVLLAVDDATVTTLITEAPDSTAYPQAGALILLDEMKITRGSDGRVVKEGHRLIKILQDRARDRMSDQKIRYNGTTERCVVITAQTHMKDGSVEKPEEDGIMDVSDPEAARAPFYSSARLKVVSFPGVDMDCVLELKYRVEPLPEAGEEPDSEFLSEDRLFGGTEPRLRQELTLVVPVNNEVHYQLFNSTIKPEITRTDDTILYHWVFKDQPQIIPEFATVPMGNLVPRLVLSDAEDFQEVGAWVAEKLKAPDQINPAVAEKARELTAGITDEKAKVNALAYFLIKEVQNVRLPLGRVGWTPTAPETILNNAYADIRDKFVLFEALAGSLGIDVAPVLVHTDFTPLADPAALDEFDTILARVMYADGSEGFISLTDKYLRFPELPPSVLNKPALLALSSGGRLITTPPAVDNTCEAVWKIALDPEGGMGGTLSMTFDGLFDEQVRTRLYQKNDSERKIFMQNLVDSIHKGAHLNSFTMTSPTDLKHVMKLELSLSVPRYAVRQGNVLIVNLPKDWTPMTWDVFSPALPRVNYPVLISTTATEETRVDIEFPEGFSVAYAPPDMNIDRPELETSFRRTDQPGSLQMLISTTWHEGIVQPEVYPQLWKAFGGTRTPARDLVLLKK